MKTILKSLIFFSLFLFCSEAFSQKQFDVPKKYAFNKPEDYTKYDSAILLTANWLQKLKMDQWIEKRVEAEKFLMAWTEGNPKVKIELNPKITAFTETNPHLKAIFVAGWAKFAILNPLDTSTIKGNLAGLKAVCKYYDFDPNLNRDKQVEELIHLNEKGKMRAWVKEMLKPETASQ